jgi:hypothetical protein
VRFSPDDRTFKEREKLRSADLRADGIEDRRRARTYGLNRGYANHDDEGQHDCVFNRCRAIIGNQKASDTVPKIHDATSWCGSADGFTWPALLPVQAYVPFQADQTGIVQGFLKSWMRDFFSYLARALVLHGAPPGRFRKQKHGAARGNSALRSREWKRGRCEAPLLER